MPETFDRGVMNIANLASWATQSGKLENEHVYRPTAPKPIQHGPSMAFFPNYFLVTGYMGPEKKEEFYSSAQYSAESARVSFQQKYYAAGVRGVQVKPLYDLGRFA